MCLELGRKAGELVMVWRVWVGGGGGGERGDRAFQDARRVVRIVGEEYVDV